MHVAGEHQRTREPLVRGPAVGVVADQRLEQRTSPAQLLLSELLALPSPDLVARITTELDRNAALELPPPPTCRRCGRAVWAGDCLVCAFPTAGRSAGAALARTEPVALESSPRERLLADAAVALGRAELEVAAHLLAATDDLGLLTEPVESIAARLGIEPAAVRAVIELLRIHGMPGMCSSGIAERLALQVADLRATTVVPSEVEALVARGLEQLVDGSVDAVAAMSGLEPGEVRDALAWIRAHVPAQLFSDPDASVPPPVVDLMVRSELGRLVVDVVPGPWSGLRVADSYVAEAHDPLVAREVARAQRFMDGLGRRAATLLDVAEVAVVRQARRLREGPRGHVPLRRWEVAAELGVHESTVSRAVVGKHLLLPSGETVAFAELFGASVGVENCLRDIVGAETVPLSDTELVFALAAQGHRVARRTVAKYRTALGIPAKHQR